MTEAYNPHPTPRRPALGADHHLGIFGWPSCHCCLGLRRAQQGTVQPGQKIDNFTLTFFSGYEFEGRTEVQHSKICAAKWS